MDVRTGQCQSGTGRFKVTPGEGFGSIRRRTSPNSSIVHGEDALTRYGFHTGAAQHFFCSRYAIDTHNKRRFDQQPFAVNAPCLGGVNPFDFADVPVIDEIKHTIDTGGPTRCAGNAPLHSGRLVAAHFLHRTAIPRVI